MNDSVPVLEVAGLSVELPSGADRKFAIEAMSFQVRPREIVCLVGESGSGKSVAAFTVMGLLPKALRPVAGRIALAGEDLLSAPPERLRDLRGSRMGMIFQEPMTALNPVMTCGAQIDEVLAVHTSLDPAARRARILDIMNQVRLPEPERLIDAYPHQLSGGQRQRIMIAMALVLEPALLIADEPTTALDVTTQAQILELIKDLQRDHATGVLFITHDFGVVAEIAHRVAVMQWGKLVEFGTTEDVLKRPRHPYTKMLISSVPGIVPRHRPRPETARPTVLKTEALGKTYADAAWFRKSRTVKAAESVSIEVRRGETLGIVGESGSGKSTVARCVARLIEPSAGRIWLAGDDIAGLSAGRLRPHRRKIQIVFQDPYRSLNPRRTVGESIVEGPMNYGLGRAEALARARSLMETVRLDPGSLDRYPHQFSGGQRQRICIARALAMEPELLIADEAVSALDVSVQAQVLELLDDIRQKLDLAMLFITHDLRVAAQVCDYVAVMSQGQVVEYGTAPQVFGAPRHDYTKALFAAAPGRNWEFGKFAAG
ncbi:MAG: ABC transporter ATP-binding protein [Alphaproteobacteria bacterium]|nr:ABC transporter ATP-binding protein [Alphaproteobacteria bacterium]